MTLTFNNVKYIKISLASPQRIRELSYGEVKKPETKNYKTFKPERDGLFCERIFGPEKDYECACGKYKRKRIKTKGIICDKCGVEVTKSDVRRERMGHIELAAPVVHFWFLQGNPGIISILLDLEDKQIKEVVYFESFVCTDLDKDNISKLMFLVKLGYINKRRELVSRLEEIYESLRGNEAVDKAFSFINKVGTFLIDNSPIFLMDSKKIEKLERKLDEDYASLTKRLYSEAKKEKKSNELLNDFIRIFENIEHIDKGRSDRGYKGYLEIQRLLHKVAFKEIFKNEEKELLYETEKYEKEKVVFLNMIINPVEEIRKIVSISLNKVSQIVTKSKNRAELIERIINLDIGSKLVGLRDKNLQKRIKKDLDNVLKLVVYPFISYLDSLIDASKNDYISLIDSYKFSIKDLKKMHNDCIEITNDLYALEDDQSLLQENPHLVREIKNLVSELIEYKIAISDVMGIVEILENLKKVNKLYSDLSENTNDIEKWKKDYLSAISQYEDLKKEYYSLYRSKLSDKPKDRLNEVSKALREMESKILELYEYFVNNIFTMIDSKFIQRVVRILSDHFTVFFKLETGAEPIRELLSRIDLEYEKNQIKSMLSGARRSDKKLLRRLGVINSFIKGGVRPEWMVLEVLPVLPPELRPIVQLEGGKFASSDLNDLYRRIINRNNRLKRLIEIQAPEIIINNEKRMLQKAVDALIDNAKTKRPIVVSNRRVLKSLSDNIQGKQGRFRYNLLGKRVDYSGRSVIVVNPKLKFYECGLPEEMVLELFKPFIINKLIEEGKADNIKKAKRMLELRKPEIWPTVQRVIENFPVILNRAPTLHRLSIQAFYPKIVKTKAIQIHPLVCSPYNADFDGDQMAVHIPLSVEAMLEYRNLLLSINNMLIPANGDPANVPSQDMVLGAFWLTFEDKKPQPDKVNIYISSPEEAYRRYFDLHLSLHTWVYYKVDFEKVANSVSEVVEYRDNKILTTIGRIIFNDAIRKHLPDFPYINFVVGKKELKWIVEECIYKYGMYKTQPVLDELKEVGFSFATRSGTTISVDELIIPPRKYEIIREAEAEQVKWEEMYDLGLLNEDEYRKKIIDTWYEATDRVTEEFKEYMSKYQPLNSIWMLANSGARGNVDQAKQLVAIRGLMVNAKGEVIPLPIKNSFAEGLGVFDYFIASHGGRKGLVDTALRTANAGYLTRRLVDVAQDIVVREDDCQTDEYIVIRPIKVINYTSYPEEIEVKKSFGRVAAEDIPNVVNKYDIIDWNIFMRLKSAGLERVKVFMEEELLPLYNRVRGRIAAQDFINPENNQVIVRKGELIDKYKAREIAKYYVEAAVRSVLKCKVFKGVCRKCYGEDLGLGNVLVDLGEAVGIIAAQSIGEPGTQLTLRTFHTGGVALESDIIQGIPRTQELLEVRKRIRSYSDLFVTKDYKVEKIYNKHSCNVIVLRDLDSGKIEEKEIPLNKRIVVSEGQKISAGTLLVAGAFPPKEYVERVIEDVMNNAQEVQKDLEDAGVRITRFIEMIGRSEGIPLQRVLQDALSELREIDNVLVKVDEKLRQIGISRRVKEKFEVIKISVAEAIKDIVNSSDIGVEFVKDIGNRIKKIVKDVQDILGAVKNLDLMESDTIKRAMEVSQLYILDETQKVYLSQGVFIHDKHMEIIIRQMFRFVRVEDPGDSTLMYGELVDKSVVEYVNNVIIGKGGKPVRAIPEILPISKAALESESWLSAASFQETSRVISYAAISGKKDYLIGLKENIIIGKPIPVGTNYPLYKKVSADELIEDKVG